MVVADKVRDYGMKYLGTGVLVAEGGDAQTIRVSTPRLLRAYITAVSF